MYTQRYTHALPFHGDLDYIPLHSRAREILEQQQPSDRYFYRRNFSSARRRAGFRHRHAAESRAAAAVCGFSLFSHYGYDKYSMVKITLVMIVL